MEKGYKKWFDGNERLICDCGGDERWTVGTKWLEGIELWLKRKEE